MEVSLSDGDDSIFVNNKNSEEGATIISDSEIERCRLREHWELASVLNFLNVFEQVIRMNPQINAEEIETGLLKPDELLSHLHVTLLKGIPPVCKTLNNPGVWVTALCKKIAEWWPWVAEGDLPLVASKGGEVSLYKELDPTTRLQILKALCEIRSDQDDIVSYINDAIKSGIPISSFRKDRLGGDGNGTTYWCDGSYSSGYRLYKEICQPETVVNAQAEGGCLRSLNYKWETVATNFEEFCTVVDKFSSSENNVEIFVAKSLVNVAIPALEKIHKKKELALKRKQAEEKHLDAFRNSCKDNNGFRSCRNRKPVNYTFDAYDQIMKEAIEGTVKGERSEDLNDGDMKSGEGSISGSSCMDSEDEDCDYDDESDDDRKDDEKLGDSDKSLEEMKEVGSAAITRLQATTKEARRIGAKYRLRQRPTRNTAIEYSVVPDSDDSEE